MSRDRAKSQQRTTRQSAVSAFFASATMHGFAHFASDKTTKRKGNNDIGCVVQMTITKIRNALQEGKATRQSSTSARQRKAEDRNSDSSALRILRTVRHEVFHLVRNMQSIEGSGESSSKRVKHITCVIPQNTSVIISL
jgi:hypothetical protein